jgi:hypothetical protein
MAAKKVGLRGRKPKPEKIDNNVVEVKRKPVTKKAKIEKDEGRVVITSETNEFGGVTEVIEQPKELNVVKMSEAKIYVGKRVQRTSILPEFSAFKKNIVNWWNHKDRLSRKPHHPTMHLDNDNCGLCDISQPNAEEEYSRL